MFSLACRRLPASAASPARRSVGAARWLSDSLAPISKEEVEECQTNWANSIKMISKVYLEKVGRHAPWRAAMRCALLRRAVLLRAARVCLISRESRPHYVQMQHGNAEHV
mmetsp:Transcript_77825/g.223487  ORF Transcript_77825/g.223487 Transcript_77825/m.223487 type:complete len:110 (-) Transcript_77825:19-348(-)